tara:strand:- start:83 stop:358 length:276 start_codon:yes stop_codon:yes gene_type:complete
MKPKDKYFIIEKYIGYQTERYTIHKDKMYDLTTAMKIMLALDTINENKESYSYYLQKVDLTITDVEESPLVLTDEVKKETESKSNQEELPF